MGTLGGFLGPKGAPAAQALPARCPDVHSIFRPYRGQLKDERLEGTTLVTPPSRAQHTTKREKMVGLANYLKKGR